MVFRDGLFRRLLIVLIVCSGEICTFAISLSAFFLILKEQFTQKFKLSRYLLTAMSSMFCREAPEMLCSL